MKESKYCLAKHPLTGLLCSLRRGHNKIKHVAWDNTREWKGSPGAPVAWSNNMDRQITDEAALDPMTTQSEARRATYIAHRQAGFTGDPCPICGSMKMVQDGKCAKCAECGGGESCG
jgi:hypothetical protein